MFLIWGNDGDRIKVDNAGYHKCDNCNNNADFSAVVDYHYFHLWYIISFITSRKYAVVCDICNHGHYIDKTEFKNNYKAPKIPFMRRTGKYIAIILVALFIWLFFIGRDSNNHYQNRVSAFISQPMVNDLYLTDLTKIENSGYENNKKSYGVMKLVKYDAENNVYYFIVSNEAYTSSKKLNNNIRSLSYSDINDIITLSEEEINTLRANKIIYDVRR